MHTYNIIHGDIKPENIILHPSGNLFLADFGCNNSTREISHFNKVVTLTGAYTAPEKFVNKATFASDIYSLGVTCIYLLTFVDPCELFDVHEKNWIWRPFLTNMISESLCQILDKMVHPATKIRYQFVEEVYTDLNPQPTQNNKGSFCKTQTSLISEYNQAVKTPLSNTQIPVGWPTDKEVLAAVSPSALNYYTCQLEDQIEAMNNYIQQLQTGNYYPQPSLMWKPNSLNITQVPVGWLTDEEVLAAVSPSVLNYYACQLEDQIEAMNNYIQRLQTRCPQCISAQLNFSKKSFNWGRATAASAIGAMTLGPVGWLGGLVFGFNENEIEITCLKCGYRWKPSKT